MKFSLKGNLQHSSHIQRSQHICMRLESMLGAGSVMLSGRGLVMCQLAELSYFLVFRISNPRTLVIPEDTPN